MGWLFSAHAEVFPLFGFDIITEEPLLRTRGGISILTEEQIQHIASSPHTRRYFPLVALVESRFILFSAHAEVFPVGGVGGVQVHPLLRTRGGISQSAEQCDMW
ncbi:hypothetical protein cgR_0733 [Corynebacterium glutamicum R]|uniref:Uncharacterized protein n=2 Tax=Corynebacterium glutamicum TaxID=1718 RepID=Q5KRK5_CORGT|nr:hypothetical protein [Corynebacterium glutamicum]BAF53704.1 hypothetical protein cgR_0733 [Corynebacterium glutamicum R]